ncbi:putative meiotic recombination protein Ski8/Rec14 [Xylariomycetidae sp. FL0641]|nr:putative meiotic recombination protein Ski8/Rec14 [Xylariomycetidae sp. FL0641]
MAAALQPMRMAPAFSALLPRLSPATLGLSFRSTVFFSQSQQSPTWLPIPALAVGLSGAVSKIPSLLGDIWEGILRAVPKSKTSHMKKRHRQYAGKALPMVTNLNKCPACGQTKKTHTLCPSCFAHINAHTTDVFAIAATPTALISASGSSTLHVHATTQPGFPLVQSIPNAHKLGCHHLATSRDGKVAASAGFGGEVKLWKAAANGSGDWEAAGELDSGKSAGEAWAIALSEEGQFLAATTYDGRINVWDLLAGPQPEKIREYETASAGAGSYGLCIDLSRDGRFTASGHQNGAVYVFNNDTGRLQYSLPGLVKPVRAIAFSPAGTRLAAAGDAALISTYDVKHGEPVGNLTGHAAWVTSLDWSDTGEYLLSGALDGKVKVWSVERAACVATHAETDAALWAVRWLPKTGARAEMFCTAGANRSITFYREATGN